MRKGRPVAGVSEQGRPPLLGLQQAEPLASSTPGPAKIATYISMQLPTSIVLAYRCRSLNGRGTKVDAIAQGKSPRLACCQGRPTCHLSGTCWVPVQRRNSHLINVLVNYLKLPSRHFAGSSVATMSRCHNVQQPTSGGYSPQQTRSRAQKQQLYASTPVSETCL